MHRFNQHDLSQLFSEGLNYYYNTINQVVFHTYSIMWGIKNKLRRKMNQMHRFNQRDLSQLFNGLTFLFFFETNGLTIIIQLIK